MILKIKQTCKRLYLGYIWVRGISVTPMQCCFTNCKTSGLLKGECGKSRMTATSPDTSTGELHFTSMVPRVHDSADGC